MTIIVLDVFMMLDSFFYFSPRKMELGLFIILNIYFLKKLSLPFIADTFLAS